MERERTNGRMAVCTKATICMTRSMALGPTHGLTGESNIWWRMSFVRYDGQWSDGKQHGKGKYVLPDGSSRSGWWEDGKRTRWEDELHTGN
jgi:hypothetical protein